MGLGRAKSIERNGAEKGISTSELLASVEAALDPLQQIDAIKSRPASHYGNNSAINDPAKLASMTIDSVAKLGATTAGQIDKTANEIMRGAEEIRDKLLALAEAIRGHTNIASEYVTEFCGKATMALEGVKEAAEKFKAQNTQEAPQ